MNHWNKEIATIPNLLSLFRILLIPVYISLYLNASEPGQFYTAGGILALSCLTDAADGMIARKWNMITKLGKIMDPLADKLTQFAVMLCLSYRHPPLRAVIMLFVTKELFQLCAGWFYFHQGRMLTGALMAGKVSTAVVFVSLILMVLFPDISPKAVIILSFLDTVVLSVSFACYLHAYLWGHGDLRDI